MKKMEPSYQRSMVIVHGLSEQSICSNIKSNLRLPQEIISRDKHRLTRAHREKQLKMSCQALHNAPPNRT